MYSYPLGVTCDRGASGNAALVMDTTILVKRLKSCFTGKTPTTHPRPFAERETGKVQSSLLHAHRLVHTVSACVHALQLYGRAVVWRNLLGAWLISACRLLDTAQESRIRRRWTVGDGFTFSIPGNAAAPTLRLMALLA